MIEGERWKKKSRRRKSERWGTEIEQTTLEERDMMC